MNKMRKMRQAAQDEQDAQNEQAASSQPPEPVECLFRSVETGDKRPWTGGLCLPSVRVKE